MMTMLKTVGCGLATLFAAILFDIDPLGRGTWQVHLMVLSIPGAFGVLAGVLTQPHSGGVRTNRICGQGR